MQAILKIITPVLGGLGILLTLLTIFDFNGSECSTCWALDYTIYFTYFLFFLGLVLALVSGVVGTLAKPGSLKGSLIGIGGIVLILIISYALASDEILESYPKTVTSNEVKWSDTGLIMLYFLFAGAIGSVIFSWVNSLIRK